MKFIATALVLMICGACDAHEAPAGWQYDVDCCMQQHCHPIPASETPRITPDGYILTDGTLVYKWDSRVRFSKDVLWHECRIRSWNSTVLRCLYVPSGGM